MTPAQLVHSPRVEGVQARLQPVVTSDHLGDGIEHLTGQPQFAGAVDPNVTGQHLLDQRGPGPRQAEDKDRLSVVAAGVGQAVEEFSREAFDESIDESAVFGRVVNPVLLDPMVQDQGVGRLQAGCGLGVIAEGVAGVGQAEEQVRPAPVVEVGVVEARANGRPVRVRQPAAQQRRQAGQRPRRLGGDRTGPAIAGLRLGHRAELLVKASLLEQGIDESGSSSRARP